MFLKIFTHLDPKTEIIFCTLHTCVPVKSRKITYQVVFLKHKFLKDEKQAYDHLALLLKWP